MQPSQAFLVQVLIGKKNVKDYIDKAEIPNGTHFSNVNLKGPYMADSKFTKSQERAFYKLKKALEEVDDVVYVTPSKKKKKTKIKK